MYRVLLMLGLLAADSAWAAAGNGSVEYRHLAGRIEIRISDPDGVRDYTVREMRTGRELVTRQVGCEPQQNQVLVTIRVRTTWPMSLRYTECPPDLHEEFWGIADVLAHDFTDGVRIAPPPPPQPTPLQWIIIAIVAIVLLVIWWTLGPFFPRRP